MPCRSSVDVRARFPCFQTLMPDICFLPRLPKVSGLERVQQRDFDADTDTVRVGVTACSAWGGGIIPLLPSNATANSVRSSWQNIVRIGKNGGEGVFLSSVC